MSDINNVSDELNRIIARQQQMRRQHLDQSMTAPDIQKMTTEADIAVLKHRADEADRRAERVESKIDRIGDVLTDIRVELAKRPTTAGLWGMVATVIGVALTMIGVVAAMLAIPAVSQRLGIG